MRGKSDRHGNTKSLGAAARIDELVREYGVKASIRMSGNVEAQPRMQEQVKEAGITQSRADRGGFTLDKTIALLASLAFVAAVFGVSVNAINSVVDGRLDDMNARFDRLEDSIDDRFNNVDARFNEMDARFDDLDARFDDLDAKVDANTQAIARLSGVPVVTLGSSDSQ